MNELRARLQAALGATYAIERELGQGGMATVYLAQDAKHQRRVAVKVLHPDLAAALGGERFLAEIRTTANLQHPHILPLHDSGEAGGFLYYVMPFVDGESLRDRLDREQQLPMEDALRIAREVADALEYAHKQGVVHRDIKPENILLQGGHAAVADFGIALAVQSAGGQRMTQTGLSLGTPQYMSPEQAMGERTVDARSDIYALGAVLYEMLTGDPPFLGSSVQAIVAKVLTEKPTAPSTVRDTVTPGVEQAVLRALSKLPADRFGTAAEFAAALSAGSGTGAGTHAAMGARRGATGGAATSPAGPWRRVSAGLAVVTLSAIGFALWAFSRGAPGVERQVFDAVLPDSAPMSAAPLVGSQGFGVASSNISLSPEGDFVVYAALIGDSTMLWYRSLVDATARPIAGTALGVSPRISPDGERVVFSVNDRVLIVPVVGGAPRRLRQGPLAVAEWVSPTRLLALESAGFGFQWLDPEVGAIEGEPSKRISRCVQGVWIPESQRLVCSFNETGVIVDPVTGERQAIRARNADGSSGGPVTGSGFRVVDGRYMLYATLDGDLRGAPYDPVTSTIGRSVTVAHGIRRGDLGIAQMDVGADGTLGYVPARVTNASQMVVLRSGRAPVRLAIDRASFLRFDLSPDGRRLAAVVATGEAQELRIYDLTNGQKQTWLTAATIRTPLWSPRGDRIIVRVQNGTRSAILLGSPTSSAAPDTIFAASEPVNAPEPKEFHSDSLLLASDLSSSITFRFSLDARPLRFDTLFADATFATISPDGRRVAWHMAQTSQLMVSSYPLGGQQRQVVVDGIEPLWLSPTELLYRSGVSWHVARLNAASGELVGSPRLWARDARFVDTPGWSNRLSRDGGIIYAQSPEGGEARYLRFMPGFVKRMKVAVDAANR